MTIEFKWSSSITSVHPPARNRSVARWALRVLSIACMTLWMMQVAWCQQPIDNRVYSSEIRSVQFLARGHHYGMPIIPMGEQLNLDFDDLGPYSRRLVYTIIHCDRHWHPSDIPINFYMEGFDDAVITDFHTSLGTLTPYVHYRLTLPNQDIQWLISGNYILKVWDEFNEDEVLMTLRFVVYEPNISLTRGTSLASVYSGEFDTHEEITFAIRIKDVGLDDPMRSVHATVIQNCDWQTCVMNVEPQRVSQEELIFDRNRSVVFQSMPPYRYADLRSSLGPGGGVTSLERYADGINVTLAPQVPRNYTHAYANDWDLNGSYVITNQNNEVLDWSGEYMYTLFSLKDFMPDDNEEVYVMGGFNQFQPDSLNRMIYDEVYDVLYAEILMKQGVYDYAFGTVQDGQISYLELEGADNRAENDYHVLIYYQPFQSRYERVIAYGIIH